MKIQSTILLLFGLILILVPSASAQEWRKIVPLKSTRADVERLLGPGDRAYGVVYELTDGVLSIEYSSGPCRKDRRGGWNVREGVVISFSFSARNKQRESDLKLNRKKFRRVVNTHTHGIIYYINDEEGITYEIQQGLVDGVEYYPPKRYDHLHCGDSADENDTAASIVNAKAWRGIIPLKSTKAEVERTLGKPNHLGHYDVQNDKVSIWYSNGPCDSRYGVVKQNCECLVAQDTVLRIAVTLNSALKVSKLGIDKSKFERTPIHAYEPTSTYADFTEGVVYTIVESDDTVTFIDYLPSAKDCDQLIKTQIEAAPNGWLGIIPLRSTRAEVERLLGRSKSSIGEIYTYDSPDNRVDISYASDPCKSSSTNSPPNAADVVLSITLVPKKPVLVRDLGLDKTKYLRIQLDHPENWVQYLNSKDGITVEATLSDRGEEIRSIIYRPTETDRQSRCSAKQKTNR